MLSKEQATACRLIDLSHSELETIKSAVLAKDFGFAQTIYARLVTDLGILKDIILQEEKS